MSATDEELDYINNSGMDHVTYVLLMFRYTVPINRDLESYSHSFISIAFLTYTLIVSLIHLYTISGRNAPSARAHRSESEAEEAKWYQPVPAADAEPIELTEHFVIGD